jgi:hypothetical protein
MWGVELGEERKNALKTGPVFGAYKINTAP